MCIPDVVLRELLQKLKPREEKKRQDPFRGQPTGDALLYRQVPANPIHWPFAPLSILVILQNSWQYSIELFLSLLLFVSFHCIVLRTTVCSVYPETY